MLHASCLLWENRALLLMAPHNTGKSTTALCLLQKGCRLLTDSMVFVSAREGIPLLMGFPVGRIKLRADMMAEFESLLECAAEEQVRDEVKYALDLSQVDEGLVERKAIRPDRIDLCVMERSGTLGEALSPLGARQVQANSLFYDSERVWQRNLAQLGPVLASARCHRLSIGLTGGPSESAVNGLWELLTEGE
jgi:hypothetical protein